MMKQRVAVVTGGASGIGRALCRRFAADGARVVVSDIDGAGARAVAEEIGGLAVAGDIGVESDVESLIATSVAAYGPIDVFVCNAGIAIEGGAEVPDDDWQRIMQVNVMGHVYAARHLVPSMLERGGGTFVVTASAAGLLTQVGSAPYAVSKHAAVAFAEWLAVTYGDQGLRLHCLCPEGVNTGMMAQFEADSAIGSYLKQVAIEPEQVADDVISAMAEGRFLVLPHPDVADFFQRKAQDYDRWLAGMRRFQAKLSSEDSV